MTFHGDASLPRSDGEVNFSLKTTVVGSGASTLVIAEYVFFRGLRTPASGNTILSYDAFTSADVNDEPSWNRTPDRILNVYVNPSDAIFHSVARSPMIFG